MSKHMKLSDVEAQKTYFIPRVPTTFEKAFPTVESMSVEIRPTGEGFDPIHGQHEQVLFYKDNAIPPIINCRNPRCYRGGLDLQDLIRWTIVERRLTEFNQGFSCTGYEGSPKGRRKYDDCDTWFNVKITVKYKNATNSGTQAESQ